MPPTATVDADILLDDEPTQLVDRGLSPNGPLALLTMHTHAGDHSHYILENEGGSIPISKNGTNRMAEHGIKNSRNIARDNQNCIISLSDAARRALLSRDGSGWPVSCDESKTASGPLCFTDH